MRPSRIGVQRIKQQVARPILIRRMDRAGGLAAPNCDSTLGSISPLRGRRTTAETISATPECIPTQSKSQP